MRKIAQTIAAFLAFSAVAMGQDAIPLGVKKGSGEAVGLPGSHLLQADWQKNAPAVLQAMKDAGITPGQTPLRKNTAWNFVVGSTKAWWATDIAANPQIEYAVPSTCRAVGTNCYVFVEDAMWTSRVTQQVVDDIRIAFDSSTPANASKGIYQTTTEYFGNPPNVDADSRIVILILDIKDGFTGTGGFTAGYFYAINEIPENTVQAQWQPIGQRHSNEAEIYYIDANPASLTTPSGFANGALTTAHEFQHMIHFNYDPYEVTFVNEGMSETASALCGYSLRNSSLYYQNTNINFLSWSSELSDYSRTAVFGWYLVEQFGSALTKQIVSRTATGTTGYNQAFTAVGSPLQFSDVLKNFAVATFVNDTAVDARYGFRSEVTGKPTPHRVHSTTVVATTQDTVQPYGTRFIQYVGGDSLRLMLTSGASIAVKAILEGPGGTLVQTVTPSTAYVVPNYGTSYTKATFSITNLSSSANAIYSYTSTGRGGTSLSSLNYAGSPAYYIALPSTNQKFAVRFSPSVAGTLHATTVAMNGGANGVKGSGTLRIIATQNVAGSVGGIPGAQIGSTVDVPFSALAAGSYNEIDLSTAGISVTAGVDFHITFEVIGTAGDTLQFLMDNAVPTPTNRTSSYRVGVNGLNWYNRADPNYASGRTPDYYNLLVSATIASPTVVTPPQPVYPGDANNDGLVDARDILPIGQYFGLNGPVRAGASLAWQAQDLVDAWLPAAASFADCDGNGTIAAADVQGILTNWGRTRAGSAPPAVDRMKVCEDLIGAIEASGSRSDATNAIRSEIQRYMQSVLGVSFDYALEQNWPNPFNPSTTIRFSIPEDVTKASLTIVNLLGQTVWQKEFSSLQAGRHSVVWNGETLSGGRAASGVYLYKMSAGRFQSTKRMTLLK